MWMRSGPISSSASTSVDERVCTGAKRTWSARIPSRASASVIWGMVGRVPGEPNSRCTKHATVQPSTTPAKRSFGKAVPR